MQFRLSWSAVAFVSIFINNLVVAQSLDQLPECAQDPVIQGIVSTGCDLTDFACLCSSPALIDGLRAAIEAQCAPADQQNALSFAQSLCQNPDIGAPADTTSEAASAQPLPTSEAEPEDSMTEPEDFETSTSLAIVPVVLSSFESSFTTATSTTSEAEGTVIDTVGSTSSDFALTSTTAPTVVPFEGGAPPFGGAMLCVTALAMIAMGIVFAEF